MRVYGTHRVNRGGAIAVVDPTEGEVVPVVERISLIDEYPKLGDALPLRFGNGACDRVQRIAQLELVLAPMGGAHIDRRLEPFPAGTGSRGTVSDAPARVPAQTQGTEWPPKLR